MVGTQTPIKKFKKILVPNKGPEYEKYDSIEKNACFPTKFIYLQLLDCHAMYRWKELFKRKKMIYSFVYI